MKAARMAMARTGCQSPFCLAKNPPKVTGDGKSGFFMKHKGNIVIIDDVSATWLRVTSESTHKSPSAIIGELIREKIAVAL